MKLLLLGLICVECLTVSIDTTDTSYTFPETLPGVFSVSATKQVQFSRGNLQYTQSTDTWAFAPFQFATLGRSNVTGYPTYLLNDQIDLFGWSGSTANASFGVSKSSNNNDYSGSFLDWGTQIGDGATWFTPTSDEFDYLLTSRPNAASLVGVGRIYLTEDSTVYADGLILLPDQWVCPPGVTFISGTDNSVQSYISRQSFSLAQWLMMEYFGAVFLPAAGFRLGGEVFYLSQNGYYHSATPYDPSRNYYLYFDSKSIYTRFGERKYAFPVRLVREVLPR